MMARLGEQLQSIVWGNDAYPITQEFGGYNPGTADMYQYAAEYGWPAGTHIGLDVGVPLGTNIYAAEGGSVVQAGMSTSFRPRPVWIEEDDGDIAIYGHLATNAVRLGDDVERGDLLGQSGEQTHPGTTIPDGTGPHIHFELRRSGKAIDPDESLRGTGKVSDTSRVDMSESWSQATKILAVAGAIAAGLFGLGMLRG